MLIFLFSRAPENRGFFPRRGREFGPPRGGARPGNFPEKVGKIPQNPEIRSFGPFINVPHGTKNHRFLPRGGPGGGSGPGGPETGPSSRPVGLLIDVFFGWRICPQFWAIFGPLGGPPGQRPKSSIFWRFQAPPPEVTELLPHFL